MAESQLDFDANLEAIQASKHRIATIGINVEDKRFTFNTRNTNNAVQFSGWLKQERLPCFPYPHTGDVLAELRMQIGASVRTSCSNDITL